jgi:hypothetical protein
LNLSVASGKRPHDSAVMLRCFLSLTGVLLFAGCIRVKMDPIEVHARVDVNVKVDRALDDFFGDLDKKSSTITSPGK